MCEQTRLKTVVSNPFFLNQYFLLKLMPSPSRRIVRLFVVMLMLGLTPAYAQSFDQQYAEWKQKQQWHDQQFQQRNAKLTGSDLKTAPRQTTNAHTSTPNEQLSLNQATADQLQQHLTGIGQKKAQAIVEQRQKMGGFKRIEDLLEVKGIGEKTLEKNRHKLRL